MDCNLFRIHTVKYVNKQGIFYFFFTQCLLVWAENPIVLSHYATKNKMWFKIDIYWERSYSTLKVCLFVCTSDHTSSGMALIFKFKQKFILITINVYNLENVMTLILIRKYVPLSYFLGQCDPCFKCNIQVEMMVSIEFYFIITDFCLFLVLVEALTIRGPIPTPYSIISI